MKYSAIVLSALFAGAFAHPQASATVTPAASIVSGLTPAQTCIAACPAGDVNCQAACVGAAHPNSSQVVDTTQCAMKCDQGDGTPAATAAYAKCQQACIASFFPTSQTIAANAASVAASSAASGTASGAEASSKASGTAAQTATGSAASGTAGAQATSTGVAANAHAQMGGAAAGIVGLLMGLFAL